MSLREILEINAVHEADADTRARRLAGEQTVRYKNILCRAY